jgi:UDP-glucose 4-epimerase
MSANNAYCIPKFGLAVLSFSASRIVYSGEMCRILVTGGAGCIGSDLCEALLARGHHVVALDNLSSGKIEHIEPLLSNPNFHFAESDLLDPAAWKDTLRNVDMVYHLAANPDVKFVEGEATDKDLQQNVMATYRVLEAARVHGIRRLAFSSTSAVYGITPNQPIPENATARPISLYGATKLGCEALVGAFSNLFGMQCWIFRFANVVGAKVRKKGRTVISDFIYKLQGDPRRLAILGDGRQAKSYLLAGECIDSMLYVVEHARDPLNIFNLGSSDSLSVNRIADMVVEAMGLSDVEYGYSGGEGGWPGDVPRFTLDVAALNQLGWKARHTSEDAVAIAIRHVLDAVGHPQSACRP